MIDFFYYQFYLFFLIIKNILLTNNKKENKDSLEHYKITNNRTKHIHFILIPFSDR